MAVVMMVSGLRVMWRMDRPSRTAVSPAKCVFIVCSLAFGAAAAGRAVVAAGTVAAGTVAAGDGEEDVLERLLFLDVLDLGGREELLQLRERAVRDDPPLVQDRDPVGELFGLVQVLRREQHCRAAPGEFPDGLPHLEARLWIEPGRRLVQEDHRRIPDEAHRGVQAA